jgi:hypothetical protein
MPSYGSGSSPYTGTGSLPSPPGLGPVFYGTDFSGSNPAFPDNLTAYQNTDGTVILYWTLNPIGAGLPSIIWTVETDLVDTFDSPDLRVYEGSEALIVSTTVRTQAIDFDNPLVTGNTYSVDVDGVTVATAFSVDSDTTMAAIASAIAAEPNVATAVVVTGPSADDDRRILVTPTAAAVTVALTNSAVTGGASQANTSILEVRNLIAGCVNKGMVVPAVPRLQGEFDDMFWRVKGTRAGYSTNFVEDLFKIPEAIDQITKQNMVNLLPDVVYKKDLSAGDTNLAKIYLSIGKELDEVNLETIFSNNDLFTEFVRDSSLKNNFGALLKLEQPADMKTIDFREILRVLLAVSGDSPSLGSVRKLIKAMFGVNPSFSLIRDTLDIFVDDPGSVPPVDPFDVNDDVTTFVIDFDAALVTGNTYTIDVDGSPVATAFVTDSDTTMAAIAANIEAEAGVAEAAVVVQPGADDDRRIVIRPSGGSLTLANSAVTGGASQAGTTVTDLGLVLPPTLWNNQNLSFGVIITINNPLACTWTKAFVESAVLKLTPVFAPIYILGL